MVPAETTILGIAVFAVLAVAVARLLPLVPAACATSTTRS